MGDGLWLHTRRKSHRGLGLRRLQPPRGRRASGKIRPRDRSAATWPAIVAKNLVAAGLARRAEVWQLAYAIGVAEKTQCFGLWSTLLFETGIIRHACYCR